MAFYLMQIILMDGIYMTYSNLIEHSFKERSKGLNGYFLLYTQKTSLTTKKILSRASEVGSPTN